MKKYAAVDIGSNAIRLLIVGVVKSNSINKYRKITVLKFDKPPLKNKWCRCVLSGLNTLLNLAIKDKLYLWRLVNLEIITKITSNAGRPSIIKGKSIDISKVSNHNELYYASVDIQNGKLVEAGSRTVAVVGMADSISSAEIIAENEIKSITGPLFHRKDIGKDDLIQKRIDHMRSLRW